MPLTDTSTIILVVALVVVAALLVWLSLSMAAAESAVGRVTRAGLNNKILEVQTDTETSQFIRMKKIGKIHTVQRLIANRYATSGSCAFFRITCNVFDGVLVACVASLLDAPIWLQLLCGFLFALIVGIVSVLVRPRSAGASKPIDIMLNLRRRASRRVRSVAPRNRTCPTTRSWRRFSSNRGVPPSTAWWRPMISIRKSPRCCATC